MKNKIRIYELAKKLDKTNKEIMAVLDDIGCSVKTPSNSIDNDTAQRVELLVADQGNPSRQKPVTKAARVAAVIKDATGNAAKDAKNAEGKPEARDEKAEVNKMQSTEIKDAPVQPVQVKNVQKSDQRDQGQNRDRFDQREQRGDRNNTQGQRSDRNNARGQRDQRGDRNNARGQREQRGDRSDAQGQREQRSDRSDAQGQRDQRRPDRQDNRGGFNNSNNRRDSRDNRGDFRGPRDSRDNRDNRGNRGNVNNNRRQDGRSDNRDNRDRNRSRQDFNARSDNRDNRDRNRSKQDFNARGDNRDRELKSETREIEIKVDNKPENKPQPKDLNKTVQIRIGSTVKTLAEALGKSSAEAVKALMSAGLMLPATARADDKVMSALSNAFGVKFEVLPATNPEKKPGLTPQPKKAGKGVAKSTRNTGKPGVLVERPPIVTVMGHVDHGKTTLLDHIRHSNVTAQEAGGITQHIGAYIVMHDGKQIVFLDTPGHEAFTAMRARGANVTDVVILVVAADDGVMPQTLEAISHIKAANVPLVVAVNKIDKPGAKPERIRQQLSEVGLVPEEWGGDVIMVDVSAKKDLNIAQLLEMVLLVSEMQELKGEPAANPTGVVIEAKLDKGKGPVATVIVKNGTLQRGDIVLFQTAWGKTRALLDWAGKPIKRAGPSMPVEILGLDEVPQPGETFTVVETEREARAALSDLRAKERDAAGTSTQKRASLDDLYSQMQEGQRPQLNLVVKCDVQGSLEALCASLEKLATNEVGVSIVHKGVGRIAESDVMLASTSNAIIIGFNVRPDTNAKRVADLDGVEIRTYNIIYDVIDEVKAAMSGLLKPILRENSLGEVEIREIFRVPKAGKVAGSHVTQGIVRRGAKVRIIRDGVVIGDAKVATLRHFKDEARELKAGMDCGIGLEGYQDFETGDLLEVFELIEEKRSL